MGTDAIRILLIWKKGSSIQQVLALFLNKLSSLLLEGKKAPNTWQKLL